MTPEQALSTIEEASGTRVHPTDRLDSLGMDSLDWLSVLVDLDIEPLPKMPETIADLIVAACC